MKKFTRFGLIAALCGMFVACGSDSSTSAEFYSSSSTLNVILSDDSREESSADTSSVIPGTDPESLSSSSILSEEISSSMKTAWDNLNPNISYGVMTDARDGQVYKTVTIGTQIWMAENLNYAYDVPTTTEDSSSFCYNNEPDSCAKYGRLYLWSAAMDSAAVLSDNGKGCGDGVSCNDRGIVRGVCPEGWHLPDTTEWQTLFSAVGGIRTAGKKLKTIDGWSEGYGEDSFGFSILPAGQRGNNRSFISAGDYAFFSSSTGYDSAYAHCLYFGYLYAEAADYFNYQSQAISVRCISDSVGEGRVILSSSSQTQPLSSSSINDASEYDASTNTLTDLRDGQIYKTVTIGEQTWMAQNLNYAYNEITWSLDSSSFCYNNEPDSCAKYGRLYLWNAAMDSSAVFSDDGKGCGFETVCNNSGAVRGVCPEGWHLPSFDEWGTLIDSLGQKGENPYGFSVLAAGYCYDMTYYGMDCRIVEDTGYFWASTEVFPFEDVEAYSIAFKYEATASWNNYKWNLDYKLKGYSVRCLKDSDEL